MIGGGITYPGFGLLLIISSGIWSSSHGGIDPSFSREFIADTMFFKSSKTAEALGSTVLITQLHDVWSFSAYLDSSDADISIG